MTEVLAVIARIADELPSDCIRVAAKRIFKLPTRKVRGEAAIAAWDGTLSQTKLIQEFGVAVEASGCSPDEVSAALFASAETADYMNAQNAIDILWTGPKSTTVPVRRMEQSLCELIDSAKEKLLIVSFVAYKADKIYTAIRSAIERGVHVSFLTEASKENGGSLDVDPTVALKKKFPEAEFYRWENPDLAHPAVVHVKCAIADECKALVTSANLTGAAMENNMELGLMISSRRVASRMTAHFAALVTEHILKRI